MMSTMFRVIALGVALALVVVGQQQLQVVEDRIPTLLPDKSGNASVTLTLKNTVPKTEVDLRPSLSDFERQGNSKYRLNTSAVFDFGTTKLPKKLKGEDDPVAVKITISQLWEAGESIAYFLNAGVPVNDSKGNPLKLHAVRIPAAYNVQFETPNPEVLLPRSAFTRCRTPRQQRRHDV